jgi:hypothetical protein
MMKHCTNCGEPVVDIAKFCQKCGTKVLPPISFILPAERDNDEDDLIYKGSFKKIKKMKRALAVNNEKIPGIIDSSTAALEVKNRRAKATPEDYVTTKETKSKYGVDPKNVEKRVAEIWTVEQGLFCSA